MSAGTAAQEDLRAAHGSHCQPLRPSMVAIEDVFYAVNVKSALKLGHVRGVAMLVAAQAGLHVVAYAPLAIKSAVVGYGTGREVARCR